LHAPPATTSPQSSCTSASASRHRPVVQHCHRRLLRWAGHVPCMPMSRVHRGSCSPAGSLTPGHRQPANDVWPHPEEGAGPIWTIARFRCVEQGRRRPSGMEEGAWPEPPDAPPEAGCLRRASSHIFYRPLPPPNFCAAAPTQTPPTAPADAHTLADNLAALPTPTPPTNSPDPNSDSQCKPPSQPTDGELHPKLRRVDDALDSPAYQT